MKKTFMLTGCEMAQAVAEYVQRRQGLTGTVTVRLACGGVSRHGEDCEPFSAKVEATD